MDRDGGVHVDQQIFLLLVSAGEVVSNMDELRRGVKLGILKLEEILLSHAAKGKFRVRR